MRRGEWLNLNGVWDFEIDHLDRLRPDDFQRRPLSSSILVPFPPEAPLSGVDPALAKRDIRAVWYRREVTVPASWIGRHLLLHLQASDYDTTVWIDGEFVGMHRGGFTPIDIDISETVGDRTSFTLLVRARDAMGAPKPSGKQTHKLDGYEAYYSRITGIWQTVWIEPVTATHLGRPRITPDVPQSSFQIDLPLSSHVRHAQVSVELRSENRVIATSTVEVRHQDRAEIHIQVPADEVRHWSPDAPHLYDLRFTLELEDGTRDTVDSYAGLRSIQIDGVRVLLNGEPVFQRLVLDQGWYPEGLLTAPSDDALVRDIELAKSAGFNGARLHEKVFEERYLYHADRLGFLVWGEFPDWGVRVRNRQLPPATIFTQWSEAIERDYSHPSIVGWCPLNETFERLDDAPNVLDDVTVGLYRLTKALDGTRPVIDASGYSHRVYGADIYDSHNYEQDPETFAQQMSGLGRGEPFVNVGPGGVVWSVPYAGQPYFCSEFGGVWWDEGERDLHGSWGYGARPRSVEEWFDRVSGLMGVLLDDPNMFGYCFTQLTDVFQERNGVYTFDRRPKLDPDRLRAVQQRPAAIEAPVLTISNII